jgi:hypothetical protein
MDVDEAIRKLKPRHVLVDMTKAQAVQQLADAALLSAAERPFQIVHAEEHMQRGAVLAPSPIFIGRSELVVCQVTGPGESIDEQIMLDQLLSHILQKQRAQRSWEVIQNPTFELGLPDWMWGCWLRWRGLTHSVAPEHAEEEASKLESELELWFRLQAKINGSGGSGTDFAKRAKALRGCCRGPEEARLLAAWTVASNKPRIAIRVRDASDLLDHSQWSLDRNLLTLITIWRTFSRIWGTISWEFPVRVARREEAARVQHEVQHAVHMAVAVSAFLAKDKDRILIIARQSDVELIRDGISKFCEQDAIHGPWQAMLRAAIHVRSPLDKFLRQGSGIRSWIEPDIVCDDNGGFAPGILRVMDVHQCSRGHRCETVNDLLLNALGRLHKDEIDHLTKKRVLKLASRAVGEQCRANLSGLALQRIENRIMPKATLNQLRASQRGRSWSNEHMKFQ